MKENIVEQQNIDKEKFEAELSEGLASLGNNNSSVRLLMFLKKHGIQNEVHDVRGARSESYIRNLIDFGLSMIEKDLNYQEAFRIWKLLKDCGILSKEKLEKYVNNYIKIYMSSSQEQANELKSNLGISSPVYDEKFRKEFLDDLISEIKDRLGWDVSLIY